MAKGSHYCDYLLFLDADQVGVGGEGTCAGFYFGVEVLGLQHSSVSGGFGGWPWDRLACCSLCLVVPPQLTLTNKLYSTPADAVCFVCGMFPAKTLQILARPVGYKRGAIKAMDLKEDGYHMVVSYWGGARLCVQSCVVHG